MIALIITVALAIIGGTLLAVGLFDMEARYPDYKGEDFLNDDKC
jgi:hypothetical protein